MTYISANVLDALRSPSSLQDEGHQSIAARLEDLAIEIRSMSDKNAEFVPSSLTLFDLARKIYSARRTVDAIFGMNGFAVSPAWDVMLDLYQAKINQAQISVTSACIGGACPPTTGLRWLQVLENLQLIVRKPDPEDKRRQVVELTDGAKVKVEKALEVYL